MFVVSFTTASIYISKMKALFLNWKKKTNCKSGWTSECWVCISHVNITNSLLDVWYSLIRFSIDSEWKMAPFCLYWIERLTPRSFSYVCCSSDIATFSFIFKSHLFHYVFFNHSQFTTKKINRTTNKQEYKTYFDSNIKKHTHRKVWKCNVEYQNWRLNGIGKRMKS